MTSLNIMTIRKCVALFFNPHACNSWKLIPLKIPYRTVISEHLLRCNKTDLTRLLSVCPNIGSRGFCQPCTLKSDVHTPQIQYMVVSSHQKQYTVGFTDEGPRDGPILLALHGVPGSSMDFSSLFEPLLDAGLRIVTINFPGYGVTKPGPEGLYDKSCEAKSTFVMDFLKAFNIKEVECLLIHSAAAHTAYNLAANTDITRSLAMLSPIGLTPHRAIRPYWFSKVYSTLMEGRLRPILRMTLKFAYSRRGFSVDDMEQLMSGMMFLRRVNFEQAQKNAEKIAKKSLPLVFACSKKDRVVEWQIALAAAKCCGVPEENITHFDENEHVYSGPSLDCQVFPRALVFSTGGHFVHKRNKETVARAIVDMVNYMKSSQYNSRKSL